MARPHHLLIFRFSSLGDVAMTVPVIKLLLQQHPDLQITMVSNDFVKPLFDEIERTNFFTADLKGRHKGFAGLYRLYRDLKKSFSFDAIADLHDVLRTKVLRSFFLFSGKPIAVIDKGRKGKNELTRKENKILKPLKTTFQRYAEVFCSLGLPVALNFSEGIKKTILPAGSKLQKLKTEGNYIIGFAPFAQYPEKTYSPEKMKELIRLLLQHNKLRIFLFGGKNDADIFEQWEKEFERVESMAGKYSFQKELELISALDLMISMDSANLHLGSLFAVPVVSIWGATHPYAGFYGWGQLPGNAVQIDLYCRPCSVFGNKPCYRGDLACLNNISPLMVYDKVMENINLKDRGSI